MARPTGQIVVALTILLIIANSSFPGFWRESNSNLTSLALASDSSGLKEALARRADPYGRRRRKSRGDPAAASLGDSSGRTPLWLAASGGKSDAVMSLARQGADARLRALDGSSPIDATEDSAVIAVLWNAGEF